MEPMEQMADASAKRQEIWNEQMIRKMNNAANNALLTVKLEIVVTPRIMKNIISLRMQTQMKPNRRIEPLEPKS